MGHTEQCHCSSEGSAGTEGGSQAQELILGTGKASSGLEQALGDTAPGPPRCPPPPSHPPSGHFPFLKWLFAGRLAEGGTGFKCI